MIDNVKEPCGDSQKGARKHDLLLLLLVVVIVVVVVLLVSAYSESFAALFIVFAAKTSMAFVQMASWESLFERGWYRATVNDRIKK